MTNFVSVIKRCEGAGGAGSKQVIQVALGDADKMARDLITAALDPYQVFGVRLYDDPQSHAQTSSKVSYEKFFAMLGALSKRQITGDAARSLVTETLSLFSEDDAKYLSRILDKDLRIGASADSVNKAWKANPIPGDMSRKLIPTFEVMLADKCDNTEDFEDKVTFPCQADWKYDGQRTIALVREGKPVEYRARSGKEMEHLAGIFDEDLLAIRAEVGYVFVMDGESFASDFTETINAKKVGNDAAKAALRLRAFFMMPLTDWIAQKTSITMRQNRKALETLLVNRTKITLSGGREVKDFQDMTAYCAEVTTKGFDNQPNGHEGLILKDWESVYVWERSFTWTKVKNFYDVDCKIVGFYAGKKGKRLANTLGGIKVWGRTEDGTIVESDVGSGFGDALRNEIWTNQDAWLGATVVIKYQEVSKSKNKAVASLRFPTFEHRRDDKIVE
jgi:ATP-dependent DNA ligase